VSTIWQSTEHADAATAVFDALRPHLDAATVRSMRYDELD
jgi:hypothetical protein